MAEASDTVRYRVIGTGMMGIEHLRNLEITSQRVALEQR